MRSMTCEPGNGTLLVLLGLRQQGLRQHGGEADRERSGKEAVSELALEHGGMVYDRRRRVRSTACCAAAQRPRRTTRRQRRCGPGGPVERTVARVSDPSAWPGNFSCPATPTMPA